MASQRNEQYFIPSRCGVYLGLEWIAKQPLEQLPVARGTEIETHLHMHSTTKNNEITMTITHNTVIITKNN